MTYLVRSYSEERYTLSSLHRYIYIYKGIIVLIRLSWHYNFILCTYTFSFMLLKSYLYNVHLYLSAFRYSFINCAWLSTGTCVTRQHTMTYMSYCFVVFKWIDILFLFQIFASPRLSQYTFHLCYKCTNNSVFQP